MTLPSARTGDRPPLAYASQIPNAVAGGPQHILARSTDTVSMPPASPGEHSARDQTETRVAEYTDGARACLDDGRHSAAAGPAADNAGMTRPEDSSLGRPTEYAAHYDPARLFPIPRAGGRALLGLDAGAFPFHGVDVWNAYELSWLDRRGKPQLALAEFRVPATSPNLIESKSLKLYLNGFMQTRMDDAAEVAGYIGRDLGGAAGAPVEVILRPVDHADAAVGRLEGECIDALAFDPERYHDPQPSLLRAGAEAVDETLVSHLLKSNCPVTGQPDWASLQIGYAGARIERESLLRYLVAFREHGDFHEACVERIWCDLWRTLSPQRLSVYARYTRRGGIDINPFRSSEAGERPGNPRLARQ